jgi:carboxyl-terminal processing protease
MKLNKLQFLLIIGISILVGYFIGESKIAFEWKNYKPQLSIINREPPQALSTIDLSQFWTVWDKVNSMYYDKKVLDPQKMLNGAIQGLVSSLGDPYTVYLHPVQNNNFQQQLAGKFEGIGAELGMKDNHIIVIAPLDGSPAQKAGIRAGDIIAKVNDTITDGWSLQQAVDKIRGPKGTPILLGVIHKGDKDISSISITRDTITVKSVEGWVKSVKDIDAISNDLQTGENKDKQIMYIRLSQFGDGTNQDWVTLVGDLIKKPDNVSGMIFDLRNNPGGYLTDATFIAAEFLPEGTPVVIEDMGNGDTTTLSVTRKGSLQQYRLLF